MDMKDLVSAVKKIEMTSEMRERIIQKCYDIARKDSKDIYIETENHLGDETYDQNIIGGR